jgi:hypothetical protein
MMRPTPGGCGCASPEPFAGTSLLTGQLRSVWQMATPWVGKETELL